MTADLDIMLDRTMALPRGAIVSGIGRSGTAYVAEVLRRCGLDARHEYVFRGGTLSPCARYLAGIDVEVSGFAMSHLYDWQFRDYPVAQVVRHPLSWLRSWSKKRFAHEYVARHLPGIRKREPLLGTPESVICDLEVWVCWNIRVAQLASFFFRVEDMAACHVEAIALLSGANSSQLAERADEAIASVPKNLNTAFGDEPHEDVTWDTLPQSRWVDRTVTLARRFGYEVP